MSLSLLSKNNSAVLQFATITETLTSKDINFTGQLVGPSGNFSSVVTNDLYYENLHPPVSGGVLSIVDGDGIAVDSTDPAHPVISTSVSEGFRASLSADINDQAPNVPITGTWQTTGVGDFNIAGWDNTTGIYTAQASQGIYQISMGMNAYYGDGGAVIIAKYPTYTPVPIMGYSGNPTINSSYVSLTGGDRVYLMGYGSVPFTVNQYDPSIAIPTTWFSIIRIGDNPS